MCESYEKIYIHYVGNIYIYIYISSQIQVTVIERAIAKHYKKEINLERTPIFVAYANSKRSNI